MRRRLTDAARSMAPSQQFVRGVFSGGTFCFEAQLEHAANGVTRIRTLRLLGTTHSRVFLSEDTGNSLMLVSRRNSAGRAGGAGRGCPVADYCWAGSGR